MHFREFNQAYTGASRRLRTDGDESLEQVQRRLRELAAQLETDHDRQTATSLIDTLAEDVQPAPPPSPLYLEALEIERLAFSFDGTDDERIAVIADARRKIWAIADRVPGPDSVNIRALTRPLEHIEESLSDPVWRPLVAADNSTAANRLTARIPCMGGQIEFAEFNRAYLQAKSRVRDAGGAGAKEAQHDLQRLVLLLADEQDRQVAQTLIDNLPRRSTPAAPASELYKEALRIQEAAFFGEGTIEERIAALAEAQRVIWAISDSAPTDESTKIRALTRMLEHLQNNLTDPPFDFQDPPSRDS